MMSNAHPHISRSLLYLDVLVLDLAYSSHCPVLRVHCNASRHTNPNTEPTKSSQFPMESADQIPVPIIKIYDYTVCISYWPGVSKWSSVSCQRILDKQLQHCWQLAWIPILLKCANSHRKYSQTDLPISHVTEQQPSLCFNIIINIIIIIIIKAICNAQDPLKNAANALCGSEKM